MEKVRISSQTDETRQIGTGINAIGDGAFLKKLRPQLHLSLRL